MTDAVYFPGLLRRLRLALRKPAPPRLEPRYNVNATLTDQPGRTLRLTAPLQPFLLVPAVLNMPKATVGEPLDIAIEVGERRYRLTSAVYEPVP